MTAAYTQAGCTAHTFDPGPRASRLPRPPRHLKVHRRQAIYKPSKQQKAAKGNRISASRGRRKKSAAFHNPQALSNVQEEEESLSCARDQVVIARPPVLAPPWRYRRSLVSKGRFAIPINAICVGICLFKPSEKAISRGDRLCRRPPPPPRQGRMLVVSWIMTRVGI
jgi:hypothetical protein